MFYELIRKKRYRKAVDLLYLVLGSLLISIGLAIFLVPNKLAAGGVSGIGIIIYHMSEERIPVGISMLVLNIPLFAVSFHKLGRYFILKTLIGAVLVSVFTDLLNFTGNEFLIKYFRSDSQGSDLLLFAVVGGVLIGAGLGLVYLIEGTTGGSDLLARIITLKNKHASVGRVLLMIDTVIVLAASVVFKSFLIGIYAFVSLYAASFTIDNVLEGLKFAKAVFIISKKHEEIAEYIIKVLDRGGTALYGKGLYSGADTNVILCVVKRRRLPELKDSIKAIDQNAFIVITDVKEVLGEGF